jgi:methionyl aminopeptidase
MQDSILNDYLTAGKIAKQVRDEFKEKIKPGVSFFEIVENAEKRIKELGADLACPVTLSLNEIAAHDTASPNDLRTISENDIIKLDLGIMVNGYIADTATTICLNENYNELKKATEAALNSALKIATPGTTTSQIGQTIEETISSYGYNPVKNLTGHMLDQYILHAGISIPNYNDKQNIELKENMAFAIEPFATPGKGMISESGPPLIYRYLGGNARLSSARTILNQAKNKYRSMPFAKRWIKMNTPLLNSSMNMLFNSGCIEGYPPLKEITDGIVTQTEHTVIIKDKPIITTQ